MKPFLFLATRPEERAAEEEYAAMLACTGLDERDLRRVRLDREPLGPVDLEAYSGVVLGGGPFNVSDPEDAKGPVQRRVEAEVQELGRRMVAADAPFLGACYGIGTLGVLSGGQVDGTFAEPIGAIRVTLTAEGAADPLTGVLPHSFDAFVGHKEAVRRLPRGAVLLASSATCPVQAFRLGTRVYATQFHPELDAEGLCTRIEVYRDHGYFDPASVQEVLAVARAARVSEPARLLRRFVELFAR